MRRMAENISKRRKVTSTLLMYLGYVSVGVSFAIVGPSLLDLQEQTDSTTDQISFIFIGSAIGGTLGSLTAGIFISRVNPWLLMSISLGLTGFLYFMVPLCSSVVSLSIVLALVSLTGLIYDSGGNMHIVAMWGDEHESWMQALHCVFGAGALIGPLVAQPFLSEKSNTDYNTIIDETKNDAVNKSTLTPTEEHETQIAYAFYICGGVTIISAALLFSEYVRDHDKCGKKAEGQNQQSEEKTKANKLFVVPFIGLLFFFYWSYCVLELTYTNYLTTYVVQELGWTKSMGASLTSAFWASFTIGRGIGIFIVKWISCENLLIGNTIFTVLSLFPEVFFAHIHPSIMWITTVSFGLFMSTIYASGLTFADMYVPISGGLGALFICASSLGNLTAPLIISALFDDYGMQVFVFIMFISAIILLLVYITAQILAHRQGKRTKAVAGKTIAETDPLLPKNY